jgi:hypothetical protein
MTKQELELSRMFSRLETTVSTLQAVEVNAACHKNGVVWNYYSSYVAEVAKALAEVKEKFFNMILNEEEEIS